MTEVEWQGCTDVEEMLRNCLLQMSVRKRRLFVCACLRKAEHFLNGKNRQAVEAAEEFADGRLAAPELLVSLAGARKAEVEAGAALKTAPLTDLGLGAMLRATREVARAVVGAVVERPEIWMVVRSVSAALSHSSTNPDSAVAVSTEQSELLREVMGDPFRPVKVEPSWLAWNDGTVPRIAQAIYEERRFHDLPILADALEEANCTSEAMLAHCRAGREHVRGCWVLDALLGKE